MFVCISNNSGSKDLIIGEKYQLFKHENHPKIVWVKIPDASNSVGYRTTQCYLSDFQSKGDWRNEQLEKILS